MLAFFLLLFGARTGFRATIMAGALVRMKVLLRLGKRLTTWGDESLRMIWMWVVRHHWVKIRRRIGTRKVLRVARHNRHHLEWLLETAIVTHRTQWLIVHAVAHLTLLYQMIKKLLLLLLPLPHLSQLAY